MGGNPISWVDPTGLNGSWDSASGGVGAGNAAGARLGPGGAVGMPVGVGPAPGLVGGSYSTMTQGTLREITGRGRMTDMLGSARSAFDRFRGDSAASCRTTSSGGMREEARLPNGTVVQLRDGRVDIFPPGGRPETIHFPGP